MLSLNVPFIILILTFCFHISIQSDLLFPITKEFHIKHITIIKDERFDDARIMKLAFESAQFINICKDLKKVPSTIDVTSHMLIHINPENNFERDLQYLLKKQQIMVMLISHDEQFQKIYNNLELEINHQVFLLNESSQEIYETYIVNNQHIRRKLGHIEKSINEFIWTENVNPNFYKRRANFHGLALKAVTEFSGLNMNAHSNYIKNAPFYSNNQTFLVNGYIYGFFNDLLHLLEYKLNFTTSIYKRKGKTIWGFIYPQSNGSYIGTGIVGDIFFERADIAVAPLAILFKRSLYIDYLPPVSQYNAAIYIPLLDESIDLKLFISPFTTNVWIIIFIVSILTAIMKFTIFCYYDSINVLEFVSAIWTSFIAYFGGKPTKKSFDTQTPYKIIILTSLLCGSLIWISYRSHLTSALFIKRKELPFTDLKTFLKTNWRYV